MFPGADPRWSLAELIHAVILMAHAHSLCSFVWGCGLNPEPDHSGGYTFQPPSPGHLPHSPAHEDGRQEVSGRRTPGSFLPSEGWRRRPVASVSLGQPGAAWSQQPCGVCSRWWTAPWRWRF